MIYNDRSWARALNISDRVRALNLKPLPGSSRHSDSTTRRLSKWRAQSPFQDDQWFKRRLSLEGITEDNFLELLRETTLEKEEVDIEPPPWLIDIETAFKVYSATPLPVHPPDGSPTSLSSIIAPIIRQAYERLDKGANELALIYPDKPFTTPGAAALFYEAIPTHLASMLSRTAALELHVARLSGQLRGATPEDRFNQFIEITRKKRFASKLLKEYPVLARLAATWLSFWVESSLEVLSRLCRDWNDIIDTFDPKSAPGRLTDIRLELGDRHRRGRTVSVLTFESGFRLVYKPKSMNVDVHFSELLAWLNDRGAPELRTPKALSKDRYGWSEFVAQADCTNYQEVWRFYERQGSFLALLYALEASDFHYENVIASGEHPMLVDLESLFRADFGQNRVVKANSPSNFALFSSVLKVGLLPERILGSPADDLDLSGIGAAEGQVWPHKVPRLDGIGTDELRFVRGFMKISGANHQPKINGFPVSPMAYSGAILEGFTRMYRILLEHRSNLLHKTGPLERFAEDEVRSVFRHTRFYALLLVESFHPDVLRNALDRDRLFDRLWFGIDKSVLKEKPIRLIQAEHRDLWLGDIPFFSTKVNSIDVWDSTGQRIPEFFEYSGLSAARARIGALSTDDLEQQLWFVRGSLTVLSIETEPRRQGERYLSYPKTKINLRDEELLDVACAVGDRLGKLAMLDNGKAEWVGLNLLNNRWTLAPLGIDLYDGLLGIALFQSYLCKLSGHARFRRLAECTIASVSEKLERNLDAPTQLGAFNGWSGLVYVWTHLGVLWKNERFFIEADSVIREFIKPIIDSDTNLDFLGGLAGATMVLIGFYRVTGSSEALDLAVQMGHRLIAKARNELDGLGWAVSISPQQPLTGLSHGAAGISMALMELFCQTGQEEFRAASHLGIRFENNNFSPEETNWIDLREAPQGQSTPPRASGHSMVAWCHGAPGIGLSRFQMRQHLDSQTFLTDVNRSIEVTVKRGFGNNHSLCHGDLGNLELLLTASRSLTSQSYRSQVSRLSAAIVQSIRKSGCKCGVPLGAETPGLLTGIAGIGYGLLRLVDPDLIPCVLLLEPPPVKRPSFSPDVNSGNVGGATYFPEAYPARRSRALALGYRNSTLKGWLSVLCGPPCHTRAKDERALSLGRLLEPQLRVVPRLPQVGEHVAGEPLGDPLALRCLPEESERGERLPMDRVRLEDRRHVPREGLHLLRPTQTGVEDGGLQGDERHVVGHVTGGVLSADAGEERDPSLDIAETGGDPPLRPEKPNPIQLSTGFEEVGAGLRQERGGGLETLELAQRMGEVLPDWEKDARLFLR
jgi:type 2 lantibiotic biosynthesis protein LanM